MSHDPVERLASLFVGVESFVQKVAQEPPALRRAKRHGISRVRKIGAMLHPGSGVSHRQESGAAYWWMGRGVRQLVPVARLESRRERDRPVREPPGVSGNG